MASINPFNGRKDLLITFYGENDDAMAMFKVLALDFKNAQQIQFLEKYINQKPYNENGILSFEKDIEKEFKEIGALGCQNISKNIESTGGNIKWLKCDITREW